MHQADTTITTVGSPDRTAWITPPTPPARHHSPSHPTPIPPPPPATAAAPPPTSPREVHIRHRRHSPSRIVQSPDPATDARLLPPPPPTPTPSTAATTTEPRTPHLLRLRRRRRRATDADSSPLTPPTALFLPRRLALARSRYHPPVPWCGHQECLHRRPSPSSTAPLPLSGSSPPVTMPGRGALSIKTPRPLPTSAASTPNSATEQQKHREAKNSMDSSVTTTTSLLLLSGLFPPPPSPASSVVGRWIRSSTTQQRVFSVRDG